MDGLVTDLQSLTEQLHALAAELEAGTRIPVATLPGFVGACARAEAAGRMRTSWFGAPQEDHLLEAAEVATRLGVKESKVYSLARSGELSSVRVGKYVRFRVSDVSAYLQHNGQ